VRFLQKVEKARQALASTPKPTSNCELKYGKIKDAKTAWRMYFKYLTSSLKHLAAKDKKESTANVVNIPLNTQQVLFLDTVLNFLNRAVSDLANGVLEFTYLMRKFEDNETFHMILAEFYGDLAFQLTVLRQKAAAYKEQASSLFVSKRDPYLTYEKYLNELLTLTADTFVNEYLLKNKIPLDDFDSEVLE